MTTADRSTTPSGVVRERHVGGATVRGDLTGAVCGIGLGLVVGSAVITTSGMWDTPGGPAMSLGTVAAMAGTYLCLVLLLLISRVPWLEREMGHDRMVLWHRTVAPFSLFLILAHVALTAWGFAQSSGINPAEQLWTFATTWAWMLPAMAMPPVPMF